MFRDTQEELKRLEEELLEEENKIPTDTDELLAQLRKELDEEPLDATRIFNTDQVDESPEALTQALEEAPQKENLKGLVIAALLLTAGILGLLAWWLVRLFG